MTSSAWHVRSSGRVGTTWHGNRLALDARDELEREREVLAACEEVEQSVELPQAETGERKMGDGRRETGDGRWEMGDGR
jgi:hypothetical protein